MHLRDFNQAVECSCIDWLAPLISNWNQWQWFWIPQWDPATHVTFSGRTSCHHVPDHPHHGQRHDAGDAEDHAHQAIVEAGDVAADPGVVERRGDGEWVHAERHADVRHGQVHRQELGSFEPGEAASGADQDGGIPENGQDCCR